MPDLHIIPPHKPSKPTKANPPIPVLNSQSKYSGTRILGGLILFLAAILAWFFWYIPRQSQDPGQLLEASYQNIFPDSVLARPNTPTETQIKNTEATALQTTTKTIKDNTVKTQKSTKAIVIPEAKPAKTTENPVVSSSKVHAHTVLAGQTLFQICKKYKISEAHIREFNNMSSSSVQVGQQLKIPVNGLHVVQAGETLSSLARKYNTNIAELKQINALKSDNLQLGQQLTIP